MGGLHVSLIAHRRSPFRITKKSGVCPGVPRSKRGDRIVEWSGKDKKGKEPWTKYATHFFVLETATPHTQILLLLASCDYHQTSMEDIKEAMINMRNDGTLEMTDVNFNALFDEESIAAARSDLVYDEENSAPHSNRLSVVDATTPSPSSSSPPGSFVLAPPSNSSHLAVACAGESGGVDGANASSASGSVGVLESNMQTENDTKIAHSVSRIEAAVSMFAVKTTENFEEVSKTLTSLTVSVKELEKGRVETDANVSTLSNRVDANQDEALVGRNALATRVSSVESRVSDAIDILHEKQTATAATQRDKLEHFEQNDHARSNQVDINTLRIDSILAMLSRQEANGDAYASVTGSQGIFDEASGLLPNASGGFDLIGDLNGGPRANDGGHRTNDGGPQANDGGPPSDVGGPSSDAGGSSANTVLGSYRGGLF